MTVANRRRGRRALFLGVGLALAGAAGLVLASAASLTVAPKNASAFRSCVLTGYPTASVAMFDSWVDENAKNSNKKGGATVQVGSRLNQNQRAFVRFDLTKCAPVLASAATVRNATLRLYLSVAPLSSRTYNVQRVVTPCPESATTCWTEGGLTWNNQPSVSATVTSSVTLPGLATLKYYSWDVTTDAAAFVTGTASNSGWRIADAAEGNASLLTAQFKSHDASSNAAGAPQLTIVYTP